MILDFDIPTEEIERRKQVIRDIWNYKLDNIDHIPIQLIPMPNSKGYTLKERYTDKKKQLEVQVEKIKVLFDHRAILYVEMRITESIDSVVEDYRHLMEALAPSVIAIPWMWIGPSASLYSSAPFIDVYRDTPTIYNKLLKAAKEYVDMMRKG